MVDLNQLLAFILDYPLHLLAYCLCKHVHPRIQHQVLFTKFTTLPGLYLIKVHLPEKSP